MRFVIWEFGWVFAWDWGVGVLIFVGIGWVLIHCIYTVDLNLYCILKLHGREWRWKPSAVWLFGAVDEPGS